MLAGFPRGCALVAPTVGGCFWLLEVDDRRVIVGNWPLDAPPPDTGARPELGRCIFTTAMDRLKMRLQVKATVGVHGHTAVSFQTQCLFLPQKSNGKQGPNRARAVKGLNTTAGGRREGVLCMIITVLWTDGISTAILQICMISHRLILCK